ncbi:MAG: DsbE family thiol:disulfide interchange protein [Gammaproteobacteria bacterium]|nr:DsbE family thiol:disulfide interchange protein [Gammaproteobacteria bacterium]
MWKYILPVGIFAALIVVFTIGLNRDPTSFESPLLGKPAPAFTLPSLEDPSVTVTDSPLRNNEVTLFNVWATWCSGCYQEHPFLMELKRTSDVPIYSLNWNDERDAALKWLNQLGNPYAATAFDGDGRVAIDWGVYGAPETFLIDGRGNVIYKHIAPLTADVWEKEFLPRIAQAKGAAP